MTNSNSMDYNEIYADSTVDLSQNFSGILTPEKINSAQTSIRIGRPRMIRSGRCSPTTPQSKESPVISPLTKRLPLQTKEQLSMGEIQLK